MEAANEELKEKNKSAKESYKAQRDELKDN